MRVLDLFSGTGGWSAAFHARGHDVYRIDNDSQFSDVENTIICDILDIRQSDIDDYLIGTDVILASPPCQAFSLAATGTHMTAFTYCRLCKGLLAKSKERWLLMDDGYAEPCSHRPSKEIWLQPKTDFGHLSVRLVNRTLELVDQLQPKFWWMENPTGGMKHFVPLSVNRTIVDYCQYGEDRRKPTNLWGDWPDGWTPRPRCTAKPIKNADGEVTNITTRVGVDFVQDAEGRPCHQYSPRGAKTGTQGIQGARDRAIVPYQLSEEVCLAVEGAL